MKFSSTISEKVRGWIPSIYSQRPVMHLGHPSEFWMVWIEWRTISFMIGQNIDALTGRKIDALNSDRPKN